MTNYTRDKQYVLRQLAMAKETLAKLRAITETSTTKTDGLNAMPNGDLFGMESVNGWDDCKHDSVDEKSSGLGMESPHLELREDTANGDKSSFAHERLANLLGLQVCKLEDDLKASLLAHFEEMEEQKEELISCFETMHAQLSKHHDICREHYNEMAEKDARIEELKVEKQTLEIDVENFRRENNQLKRVKSSTREYGYRISPGYVEPDQLSETLMKENSHLRGKLRKYETQDYSTMERKIAFQEILCETYKKDVMTKDSLLKRLRAENAGLREDIKNLQDEMLRVNAKRLDAEQHAMRLQQELQFSEEQISTLREKLSSSEEETTYFQRCIHVSKENSQANVFGESQLSELGNEIVALRGKCESYRDKLNDKERFLASVSKENEDLKRTVEAMKRDLSAMRSEERSLKIENERLQRENADRDIDRLSSETTAEVSTNKMSSMKHQLRHLESRVNELEIQQRDQENRETELSQEVLANLEKYTQVEQKLYLTRKELAQLQGFYESSQNKRRDLQQEVESSRRTIASLEKRLLDKKIHEEVEKGNCDAIKDNEGLHKEIQRLTEGFRTSQIEITELEKALQTAREQNSLQRLRLEAHDTLMERKDKRIKELQNELIELHNQIESLTDEILKNNRERESLRMSKRLLEQEVDLIKSRKLLGSRALYREGAKENFYHTTDPASPDSGFSETEREKAIDRLRREILSRSQHPVLQEEKFVTDEAEKLQADLALATRRLDETDGRLREVIAENENLKDQEHEAKILQQRLNEELRKVVAENKDFHEKVRILSQTLEEHQQLTADGAAAKSMKSPLQAENLQAIDEPLIKISTLQFVSESSPEKPWDYLQNDTVKNRKDSMDELNVLSSEDSKETINQLQNKIDELQGQLQDYEMRLETLESENKDLLLKFTNTQEIGLSDEDTTLQHAGEKLQREIEEIKGTIHHYEKSLTQANAENENLSQQLQQTIGSLKEIQHECKVLKKREKDWQNKTEELEGKIQGFKANLENKNKENKETLKELKSSRENLKILESERQNNKEYLPSKTEEYDDKLLHCASSLANISAEKDELLAKLAQIKDNLEEKERDRKAEQENREALQKIMQEELSAKDNEVAKLQKELSEVCDEQERLKALCESSKETRFQTEDQLLSAQNSILDLERQKSNSRANEKSLQELLQQSEESNARLQVELVKAEQKCKKMGKEEKALQQQVELAQRGSVELEREVEELKERVEVEEEKQKRAIKNYQDEHKEKEHLRRQLEDVEHALQNSHQMNEKKVFELEDALRERDNDIAQLKDELSILEDRYLEIKFLSSDTQTELSDLHAELIESKEQFYAVSQEKAKLLRDLKEVEHDITDKEQKIAALEMEKIENKRIISEQGKRVDELLNRLDEVEDDVTNLSKQNERLKKSVEEASNSNTKMETLIKESNEEKEHLEQQLLAAHESITDLEAAFQRGEDKISKTEENVFAAKDQIAKLETQLEARQEEYRALQRDYIETERELEHSQETLDSYQEKITSLEKKLRDAKANISELEMTRDNGLSNEQLLQQRFAEARDDIEKMEAENIELKEKLIKMEKKVGELLSSQETLEDRKEELEKINKELCKDLEYERDKRLALKQKVEMKDRENDIIERKIQNLEKSATEQQELSNKEMEEKAKLRDELARAKKNVSELEAAKENQEESISKIEEVLRETRNKLTTLEQRLEDSKRDNADLHEEVEEVNRKLKYAKEENFELEKTLQKQKDISDGLRNNLVERDESVMTSNYNRDVAERSLQALKKDLARKDAKLKMQKEQIEDMEGEAEKADKKIKETESSSKKLASENERLTKELADIKAKLEKAEKGKVVGKSEVPVVRVSEVQATSVGADQLIRDWSDKLSTAQTKVTDLETELLKDIKKHEARVHRTRPVPPELRRKSADYVLTDHERQSRFRSRQRPNLSRDSSLDSLRSTQSMLDYLDDRIVDENLLSTVASSGQGIVSVVDKNFTVLGNDTPAASETVTPTPSEPSTPVTAGYGSPVDSESEGPYDVPTRKTARAKSLNASTESIREDKERDVMKKQEILGKEGSQSNGQKEENLVNWKEPKVQELDINDQQPLLPEASTNLADETTSSSKADNLVNLRGKEPYIHPLPTEKPQRIDGTTENASDTQNNPQLPPPDDSRPGTEMPSGEVEDLQTATTPDLHMIFQKEISKTERNDEKKEEEESQNICFKPNSTNNLQGENRFDGMRIEEAPELQSETSQLSFLKQRAGDSQNDFQQASPSVQTDSNFHLKTKEMTEIKSDYEQPVLIQPPSEDLFQFVNLPSDNSSALVSFGEDPKPTLLNENHTFMADFDSLDIPEPQPYNMGGREILDPFEQLMRDAQRSDFDDIAPNEAESKNIDTDLSTILIFDLQQTVGRNNEDPSKGELMENCLDDVTIDVTDDATCDDVVIDRQQTAGRNNHEPRRYISNYPITDEEKGDVIHPPKQFVSVSSTDDYHDDVFNFRKSHEPVPYSVRVANGTYRDRDVDKPMEEAESIFLKDGYSDGVADFTIPLESVPPLRRVTYSDINKPQQETQAKFIPDGSNEEVTDFTKPLEPIPPPRKLKEKMKPVLFPRREKKKDNEKDRKSKKKSAKKPQHLDVARKIVEAPSDERENNKPNRPPKPTHSAEFSEEKDGRVITSLNQSATLRSSDEVMHTAARDSKSKTTGSPMPVVPAESAYKQSAEMNKSQSQIRKEFEASEDLIRKQKPERPPKPAVQAAFANALEDENVYKSPSQIRKELEEVSKRGKATITEANPTERHQQFQTSGKRSSLYRIEERGEGSTDDHAHGDGTEQREVDEKKGRRRLSKLIAAFEKH